MIHVPRVACVLTAVAVLVAVAPAGGFAKSCEKRWRTVMERLSTASRIKQELAEADPHDVEAYMDWKDGFTEARALEWAAGRRTIAAGATGVTRFMDDR